MRDLLEQQSGVVSRAQLLMVGQRPHDIARMLRRRELALLRPGVYVDHTGEPTWWQRAWGSVLHCRSRTDDPPGDATSAALTGRSALVAAEGLGRRGPTVESAPLEVVVADGRRPRRTPDLEVRRSTATLASVQWQLRPPRVRYEPAVLEVAARSPRMVERVGELAHALGTRRTTPQRLIEQLDSQPSLSGRKQLRSVLDDLATGSCSVLEHAYLTLVERAHGLPSASRQERAHSRTGVVYRDASYDQAIVELDGRAWHESVARRDRDADRDLVAAVAGRRTVRLTWGQVCDRPCWTAAMVAAVLGVSPRPCSATCSVSDISTHQVS